jgi:ribosomal protein S18 acetylase RimI-like enzyme
MLLMQQDQLPDFPRRTATRQFATTCVLRPAERSDFAFLRKLYHSFRVDELAQLPWPQEDKHAFLDQQFDFQHRYYIATFPGANFLIIQKEDAPIGRLYIDLTADIWHIIDIGLLPEWRNQRIGRALLTGLKAAAMAEGNQGIFLNVDKANGSALKLYQASEFEAAGATETHLRMEWSSRQALPRVVKGHERFN